MAESFEGQAAPVLHVELSSGPVNQGPTVSAGPDQSVTLPGGATLARTASDDGMPTHPVF